MSRHDPLTACLETLPVEIWLMVMSYLSPTDRLYGFGNINSRLNAILREAGAGIDDELMLDSLLSDELSSCITSVKLQRRCLTLDLYYLAHVRSLIILQTTQYQVSAIDPIYFPHLTHLHLASISHTLDADFDRLLERILNHKFESLVSMHLPRASFFGTHNCIGHAGLKNITIGSCRSNRFGSLISLMPNVRFLEVHHLINWPIKETLHHNKLFSVKFHVDTPHVNTHDLDQLKEALPSLQHVETLKLETKQSKCIPLSSYDTTLEL